MTEKINFTKNFMAEYTETIFNPKPERSVCLCGGGGGQNLVRMVPVSWKLRTTEKWSKEQICLLWREDNLN